MTVGSRAVLMCETDGLPKPDVRWLKDGITLVTTSSSRHTTHRTGSLQLSTVNVEDSGLYECVASNDAGTARREVVLSVHGTYTTDTRSENFYKKLVHKKLVPETCTNGRDQNLSV